MTCKAFLSPLKFKFQVKKLPVFGEYVQSVDFPGISVSATEGFKNPFQTVFVPGEHAKFETLRVTFKLDEDLDNYREIFDWLEGLGKPSNYDQYRVLAEAEPGTGEGPQVDATLSILNSRDQPSIQFMFEDLAPISLSGFKLAYTMENTEYITAEVEFQYTLYRYKVL